MDILFSDGKGCRKCTVNGIKNAIAFCQCKSAGQFRCKALSDACAASRHSSPANVTGPAIVYSLRSSVIDVFGSSDHGHIRHRRRTEPQ